jgi:hypothetical protein
MKPGAFQRKSSTKTKMRLGGGLVGAGAGAGAGVAAQGWKVAGRRASSRRRAMRS